MEADAVDLRGRPQPRPGHPHAARPGSGCLAGRIRDRGCGSAGDGGHRRPAPVVRGAGAVPPGLAGERPAGGPVGAGRRGRTSDARPGGGGHRGRARSAAQGRGADPGRRSAGNLADIHQSPSGPAGPGGKVGRAHPASPRGARRAPGGNGRASGRGRGHRPDQRGRDQPAADRHVERAFRSGAASPRPGGRPQRCQRSRGDAALCRDQRAMGRHVLLSPAARARGTEGRLPPRDGGRCCRRARIPTRGSPGTSGGRISVSSAPTWRGRRPSSAPRSASTSPR